MARVKSWGVRVHAFPIYDNDEAGPTVISRWLDESASQEAADTITKRVVELYTVDVKDEIDRIVMRTGHGEQDDITGEIQIGEPCGSS